MLHALRIVSCAIALAAGAAARAGTTMPDPSSPLDVPETIIQPRRTTMLQPGVEPRAKDRETEIAPVDWFQKPRISVETGASDEAVPSAESPQHGVTVPLPSAMRVGVSGLVAMWAMQAAKRIKKRR